MRIIVSIIAVGVVAVTAAVFAIWPVVADAPWEHSSEIVVSDSSHEPVNSLRCEAALELRMTALTDGGASSRFRSYRNAVQPLGLFEKAEQEIGRFC